MDEINAMRLYEHLEPEVYDQLMNLITQYGNDQYEEGMDKGYADGCDR